MEGATVTISFELRRQLVNVGAKNSRSNLADCTGGALSVA